MRGGGGLRIITPITIAASTSNYNLFTAAGSPADPVDVVVTISAGVTISSASTASYAFDTGIFPAGSNLTLTNNGIIVGRGGNGGNGGGSPSPLPTAGGAGGPALRAQSLVSITNNNRIAGGGGGGGGGMNGSYPGDGGGGGIGVSAGGAPQNISGSPGFAGTLTAAGGGGNTGGWSPSIGWDANGNAIADSNGGNGGGYGAAGGHGCDAAFVGPGGLGGAAGAAVVGNSNITWLATGTRNGPIT